MVRQSERRLFKNRQGDSRANSRKFEEEEIRERARFRRDPRTKKNFFISGLGFGTEITPRVLLLKYFRHAREPTRRRLRPEHARRRTGVDRLP